MSGDPDYMSSHLSCQSGDEFDPPELSKRERLELAFDAWKSSNGALSLRKAARKYGVSWETLRDRKNGAKSKAEEAQARQRLTVQEEESLRKWLCQLEAWGWPCLPTQLHKMAWEILKARGDNS